ncbi:MAG: putative dual-specificity RNA methyltransferase RlmN [Chlamydiales bacterium]|nr:putative dual-specificity RNA methyltransferase RlmN [Chlamydiales bacterium]
MPIKPIAFDLSLADWEEWTVKESIPKYRAKQIFQWIFQKNSTHPETFTNLSPSDQEKLKATFCWEPLRLDSQLTSSDGSQKLLLKTEDNLLIELVIMPYEKRTTLCLSSQVGCRMGCTFCQTGKMGLKRNLTSGEILAQLLIANQVLSENPVTNVVFMGMGEPLDNYDAVVKACATMIDPEGFNLSKSRVTVSTSGLVPEIKKLGEDLPVRLAISLHNPDNEKRSRLMPVNRKYSLEELKKVLLDYPASPRHGITFEYVMIEGVNDSLQDAKKLVHFLHGLKAKVNLIPVNPFPGVAITASSEERIREFQMYLTKRSIPAPVRYSKGTDISSGCGQLAAKREGELNMDPRKLHKQRRLLV